jgi:hypothetical protein
LILRVWRRVFVAHVRAWASPISASFTPFSLFLPPHVVHSCRSMAPAL